MGLADGDNGLHAFTGFLESNFYEVTEEGKTFDVNFAEGKEKMSGVFKWKGSNVYYRTMGL